jgi:hypothetical protein
MAARLQTGPRYGTAPLIFGGLDPHLHYRVQRVPMPGEDHRLHASSSDDGVRDAVISGVALMRAGVAAPNLQPEQAAVYQLRAEG